MSFCRNCGAEVPETASACPACGTPVSQPQYEQAPVAQPQYQQPTPAPMPPNPYAEPVQAQVQGTAPSAKLILILGIISLAVSCIPFVGIGGIVVGAIGMGKSNAYVKAGGVRCGMSITGRILSRVGMIVSIVMTVFWVIYFSAIACAVGTYYSGNYHIYY